MEVVKEQWLTITASSLMKIDQHHNFTRAVSRRYRDRGQR